MSFGHRTEVLPTWYWLVSLDVKPVALFPDESCFNKMNCIAFSMQCFINSGLTPKPSLHDRNRQKASSNSCNLHHIKQENWLWVLSSLSPVRAWAWERDTGHRRLASVVTLNCLLLLRAFFPVHISEPGMISCECRSSTCLKYYILSFKTF